MAAGEASRPGLDHGADHGDDDHDDCAPCLPLPPQSPISGMSIQAHKLWLGNLDKRLTQHNIHRFAKPYGKIVSFKYMLHTAGMEKGEPRGYCFIEYSTRQEALEAKRALDGKIALGRKISVDWARQDQYIRKMGGSVSETWDAGSVSATLQKDASTAAKIAAIEAKLLQMERGSDKRSVSPYCGSHNHYTLDRVKRKHGDNIKLHRPKPYTRTDLHLKKEHV